MHTRTYTYIYAHIYDFLNKIFIYSLSLILDEGKTCRLNPNKQRPCALMGSCETSGQAWIVLHWRSLCYFSNTNVIVFSGPNANNPPRTGVAPGRQWPWFVGETFPKVKPIDLCSWSPPISPETLRGPSPLAVPALAVPVLAVPVLAAPAAQDGRSRARFRLGTVSLLRARLLRQQLPLTRCRFSGACWLGPRWARDGAQGPRLVGPRCETRFLRLRAARTALAKTLRAALLCFGVSCWTPTG